jgi:hypothetical protein
MKLNKIVKTGVLILFLISLNTTGFSQFNYKITGKVITQDKTPLFQGNIIVYNSTDSGFVTGALIREGEFDLPSISNPQVIIKLVSLEYETQFINIDNHLNEDTILLGDITLQPNRLLDEVVVSSYVPLFEYEGTTTIVNVEETILSASATPLELLKKLPVVLVKDGQVSILGKGRAAIYLDGQRITEQQLDNIPVNEIVKFEIINDPSARYDGDVSAIIKVITRHYHYEGTNVNVRSSVAFPIFMSNSALGMNYRNNKFSLKFNYGLTAGNTVQNSESQTRKGNIYNTELILTEHAKLNVHNINAGVSYNIDSTSTTAIEYSGNIADVGIAADSKNTFSSTQISNYDASLNGGIQQVNHNLIVNYTNKLDTLGSNLFVGTQYTDYEFNMSESVNEVITLNTESFPNQHRKIESTNHINILSAQVDYDKCFSKKTSLGIGAKYSNANTLGNLNMSNLINSNWEDNPSFTSKTVFKESIFASFATFKTELKSYTISGGVRYEHTEALGETTQENQLNLSRSYDWLLPSLSIRKLLNEKLRLAVSLSYNTSVGRPSYNDLDSKVIYIDSLTSKQGNPLLLSQRDHSISATVNFGPLKIDATYYHSFNAFKNVVREGLTGENSITLFRENVNADRLYTSITLPLNTKFMNSYIYYLVGWDKVLGQQANFSQFDLSPYHYLYGFSQIKVGSLFNIELIATYCSGRFDGVYQDVSTFTLSAGISKSFLDNNLKCSVLVNDLFFTERDAGTFYYDDYAVAYYRTSSTRFIRFSVNYKIGRLKHENYKTIGVGNEENKRIK